SAPSPPRNATGCLRLPRGPRAHATAYATARRPAPTRTSGWISPDVIVIGAAGPARSAGGPRRGASRLRSASRVSFQSPPEHQEGAGQRHERDPDARREEERAAEEEREDARVVAEVHEKEEDQRELCGRHRDQEGHDDRCQLPDV